MSLGSSRAARSRTSFRRNGALALLTSSVVACGSCEERRLEPADAGVDPMAATEAPGPRKQDEVRPVYPPLQGEPDPLAKRLCDGLQTIGFERKAACCKGSVPGNVAGECVRALTAAIRDGSVTVSPEKAERCIQETAKKLEGCDWVTPLMPLPAEACFDVVEGNLAVGAKCRSALECKAGLTCRGLTPTQAGKCAAPAPPGSACGTSVDPLAVYTRQLELEVSHPECAGFCQSKTCIAHADEGGACIHRRQCPPGQHCASGKCADGDFSKVGEACTGSECDRDAACVEGACVALKEAGEPCNSPYECKASCVVTPGEAQPRCGMLCANGAGPGQPRALTLQPGKLHEVLEQRR